MSRKSQLRRAAGVATDLAVLAVAYYLAFRLRYEGPLSDKHAGTLWASLPCVLLVHYAFLAGCRVTNQAWRYVSLLEARRACVAVGAAAGVLAALCSAAAPPWARAVHLDDVPRGVILIHAVLSLVGVIGLRAAVRQWREARSRGGARSARVPTVLIGAGTVGASVVEEIARHRGSSIKPVGFLDDDPHKAGAVIHGTRVLGPVADVAKVVQAHGARQALITIGRPSSDSVRRFVDLCKAAGIPAKVVPGIRQMIEGRVNLSAIRDVAIEDILHREPVALDMDEIAASINGRNVLVTGAGGSIGSELCRTVCRFGPAGLVLVEHTENSLFAIHRELRHAFPGLTVVPCLADITDVPRITQVFAEFAPDVVLHAAAHKHVPLMEWNPGEAIKNNVLGTRTIADLAHACGVAEFVMISTDKAVNPTSIMGVSKRAAELYIQALSGRSGTRFVTVRFGNVLGSSGSVVPIFKEQIANGGPVTVTHPDMRRYFMTIPEACQLVLQAATMGSGGEIFILDMGQPVRIVDLARDLIRLSGLSPDEIEICFTGIRPGEKLFEELAREEETAQKTRHPKIFVGQHRPCDWTVINGQIDGLHALVDNNDLPAVFRTLKEIVPEYEYGGLAEARRLALVRPDGRQPLAPPNGNGWTPANGSAAGAHAANGHAADGGVGGGPAPEVPYANRLTRGESDPS